MIKLSFQTFLEQHISNLGKDPHFAEYVKTISILFKKYKKNIFLSDYKISIKKHNENIRNFIEFLWNHGFRNKKDIETLVKTIESQSTTPKFMLQVQKPSQQSIHKKIDTVLKKDFATYTLEDNDYSKLGIQIKWNGYHYKRNLDSDLDILLQ